MSSRLKWQQLLRCSLQNFWMSSRLDRRSASDMLSFRHTSGESGVGMVKSLDTIWLKKKSLEPLVGFSLKIVMLNYLKTGNGERTKTWESVFQSDTCALYVARGGFYWCVRSLIGLEKMALCSAQCVCLSACLPLHQWVDVIRCE